MTTQELFNKFSQGVNWNALLYLIYKTTSTISVVLLYHTLNSKMFSAYANLNSIIFIVILWLDFGLQKAIPRFCPEYTKEGHSPKQFIRAILLFKIIALIIALPLYMLLANQLMLRLHLETYSWFFYSGALLVVTEGLISVVRLLYHAYFLQRVFNSLNGITLIIEVTLNIGSIFLINSNTVLFAMLLANKIVCNCLLLVLTWQKRHKLFHQTEDCISSTHNIDKQFVIHAGIMWCNNNMKSLTERNVLLPLFTSIYGIELANMFKVANDGALLFYRIVTKTIGTTDTALFSHMLTKGERNETWQVAFTKLSLKISALVIPLSGIIYLLYRFNIGFQYDQYVFQFFLIITICLLLETLFSPYERILEVNKEYLLLTCAYMPYLILIIALLTTNLMTLIGLLNSLFLIHGVRLVSALIMVLITRMRYGLHYPIAHTLLVSLGTYLSVHVVIYSIKVITPLISPYLPYLPYLFHLSSFYFHP